jgi:peptidoglycan/xylan/chitin deacetylase (PgdA/CDA1 family)
VNDHDALAADLEVIEAEGYEVRPLAGLVAAWSNSPASLAGRKLVALTCDDGSDFDFRDIEHPECGMQRSFLNILRDFHAAHPGSQPGLHITSFVVVSPEDRAELDRVCMHGRGWWSDGWWIDAIASGRMDIASHSWDHNHEALSASRFPHVARGVFTSIDTREVADYQIEQAARYLRRNAPNPGARLFAYPYGPHSDYLVREYFPQRWRELAIDAAMGDEPRPWVASSNRWELPRYVHGRDWHEPQDLAKLLRDAA